MLIQGKSLKRENDTDYNLEKKENRKCLKEMRQEMI